MEGCLATAAEIDDVAKAAHYYRDGVFEAMGELRETADKLESVVDKEAWPFPTYGDLLSSARSLRKIKAIRKGSDAEK